MSDLIMDKDFIERMLVLENSNDVPVRYIRIMADEIQTLRAKVASAEVLVEALTMLLTTKEYKEVNGKDYVYDAMRITAWDMAEKALATYNKLSEGSDDL